MPNYFAYGSNINMKQMLNRCPDAVVVGVGQLHGHQLRFSGRSVSWAGGTATVDISDESSVVGVVYELSNDDLHSMDGYEGYPYVYGRKTASIVLENQSIVECKVYFHPILRESLPNHSYIQTILQGYQEFGISTTLLSECLIEQDYIPQGLFVYGTLKAGHCNHNFMGGYHHYESGTIQGELYRLPYGYPAIIEGAEHVQGELYLYEKNFPETLQMIDCLEGFKVGGIDNLYNRRITLVHTLKERDYTAWSYVAGNQLTCLINSKDPVEVTRTVCF